jgi:primosomal protein N''
MCDYERAIDAIIEEQAREEIEELHKAKRGLRAKLNPIDETIVTKDTFHQNITQLNGECLNAYIDERGNNPNALEGINYAFKFIIERNKL